MPGDRDQSLGGRSYTAGRAGCGEHSRVADPGWHDGWNWYPTGLAVTVALPNQPLASTITLIVPTALNTQSASAGPPGVDGPSSTITRFASTALEGD